jgi:hypothetical protein
MEEHEDTRQAWKLSAEQRPVGDRKRALRVEAEHWQLQEQGVRLGDPKD